MLLQLHRMAKALIDTVEFTIADNKGKWIGSGIGDIHDVRLVYRRNVRFGQTGNYVFYIQHGMRETEIKEITDVGIRIEDSKERMIVQRPEAGIRKPEPGMS